MEFLLLTFSALFAARKDERLTALILAMTVIIALAVALLDVFAVITSAYWYQTCILFEAMIITACVWKRPHAAPAVASLSMLAIVWHYAAFIEYSSHLYTNERLGPVVTEYRNCIPLIQYGQVASLFLFSPPSLRFIDKIVNAIISRVAKRRTEQGTWQPASSK